MRAMEMSGSRAEYEREISAAVVELTCTRKGLAGRMRRDKWWGDWESRARYTRQDVIFYSSGMGWNAHRQCLQSSAAVASSLMTATAAVNVSIELYHKKEKYKDSFQHLRTFSNLVLLILHCENRPATYAISQLQCVVVYHRALRISSKINSHHGTPCLSS